LEFNDYRLLKNPGKMRKNVADALAKKEFDKFRVIQDKEFESDFDKEVKKLKGEINNG